jgi:hypothetical protein
MVGCLNETVLWSSRKLLNCLPTQWFFRSLLVLLVVEARGFLRSVA